MHDQLIRRATAFALALGLAALSPSPARANGTADEVLDWNGVLRTAVVSPLNSPPLSAPAQFRIAAIVHTAMFDAINGIERRYTPIHVAPNAPRGASREAAVVQAAYTTLLALVPASSALYDQQLEASLEEISSGSAAGNSESIDRGREWGAQVANEVLAWRATDGFNPPAPPYLGSDAPGRWRPTPPALASGLLPSLANTATFVVPSAKTFKPVDPPALPSAAYAADVNEVKAIGEMTSASRTADQTEAARFWNGTAMTGWNRIAHSAALRRGTSLSENARLFALLNTAMADGIISSWNAKYHHEFWRPITAIRLASTDGNPDTVEKADWSPLVNTPPYPEYPAGHPTISGAAQTVLTSFFGNLMAIEGTSEGLPGVVRRWSSFSAAADDANLARIWAGIHFRSAVVAGRTAGDAIGLYVVGNAARPVHGNGRPGPDLGACQTLHAPAGNAVSSIVFAEGVQIYRWNGTSWVFVAPEATLFADAGGNGVVGTHYAGPTWESNSGSKVVGRVVQRCTPDPSAIPWLLLEAVSSEGPGIFEGTTYIQRVNTVGGLAPSTPGTFVNEEARVPYTTDYVFYRAQQ